VVTILTRLFNSTKHKVLCFVWIWQKTPIISLYSINWYVFITETECVYCAVRSFHTLHLYIFVWIWEQTAIISLYGINWLVFITETACVYCAVRTGSLNATEVILNLSRSLYMSWHVSDQIRILETHTRVMSQEDHFRGCVGLFLPRSIQAESHGWCCPHHDLNRTRLRGGGKYQLA
jgi:hypothetical protein